MITSLTEKDTTLVYDNVPLTKILTCSLYHNNDLISKANVTLYALSNTLFLFLLFSGS